MIIIIYMMQFQPGAVLIFLTSMCLKLSSAKRVSELFNTDHSAAEELHVQADKNNNSCPPWKYRDSNSTCVCGNSLGDIVLCEDDRSTVKILTCHCMTYSDQSDNVILVGNCPYLCTDSFYSIIQSQEDVRDMCNNDIQQYREGQMCGKCIANFSPSPYSMAYAFECAECSNYKNNWLKYILIAYLPLTIFFLIVIAFRFNAMSASMNLFVLLCQIISCPAALGLFSIFVKFTQNNPPDPDLNVVLVFYFLSSIYGIWNLDFFRMLYKPFCLHPNLSILHILSLDYAIAVYPLFLIFATYFLIKLHDRFEVFQFLWKPAGWLFTQINQQWKTSTSLIEAFGTFFLLSYVKIINISFNILIPVQLYNVSGNTVGFYVYYNGSMEYFGTDHLPFAMLAIFMFVTFNLMPLLLLSLYPCQCFQSCLNCCRLNSQVLRTFMDAFQGCYKFEPYDCRYWSAFYLFLRIAILCIFAYTKSGYFLLVTGILLLPLTSLLVVVRPYRQNVYNNTDVVLFLTVIQICFSSVGFSLSTFDRRYESFITIMTGTGLIIPQIYAIVQLLKYIIPSRLLLTFKKCLKCLFRKVNVKFQSLRNRLGDSLLRKNVESDIGESEVSQLLLSESIAS